MSNKQYPGTSFDKSRNKWKAQIRIKGRVKSLGHYDTQLAAYEVAQKAKQDAVQMEEPTELAFDFTEDFDDAGDNYYNTTIAQSNILIDRPWAMTIMQARIFVLLLRGLRRDDDGTSQLTFPMSDLVGDQPIGGRGYQYLHVALTGLDAIRIDLPMPDKKKDFHKVPLVHSLQLDSGAGTISGYFSKDVIPYLTNLVDNFTLGQVADLLSIKSPNTYRMYWLFQMWKFKSPYTVNVNELRRLTTGPDAYPQFADYRNRVLVPSVTELNQLNFDISYTEKKQGRNVDSIQFNIKYNASTKPKPKQLQLALQPKEIPPVIKPAANLTEFQGRVAGRLRKFKLEPYQIERILTLPEDELKRLMKETHPLLKEYESGTKSFDNIAATSMNRINQLFPRLYPKM